MFTFLVSRTLSVIYTFFFIVEIVEKTIIKPSSVGFFIWMGISDLDVHLLNDHLSVQDFYFHFSFYLYFQISL